MIKGMMGQRIWGDKEEKQFECIMVCQYNLALKMNDGLSAYDAIEYLSMSEMPPKAEVPKCGVAGHTYGRDHLG